MRNQQSGFTLIELMIVIAIVAILSAVALPIYKTYSDRTRFTEVVLAVADYKKSAEIAVQLGRTTAEADLDAGALGIPASNVGIVGDYVSSVTIQDGVITAASQNLGTNSTYTLTATIVNDGIEWTEGGACIADGLC